MRWNGMQAVGAEKALAGLIWVDWTWRIGEGASLSLFAAVVVVLAVVRYRISMCVLGNVYMWGGYSG
jgi:hypothetical protein